MLQLLVLAFILKFVCPLVGTAIMYVIYVAAYALLLAVAVSTIVNVVRWLVDKIENGFEVGVSYEYHV